MKSGIYGAAGGLAGYAGATAGTALFRNPYGNPTMIGQSPYPPKSAMNYGLKDQRQAQLLEDLFRINE